MAALEEDAPQHWLDGVPMDPDAEPPEPLDTLPGFPYLHEGMAAVIAGPTGGGKSSLVIACAYDAARAGLRVAYLGSEVTPGEFNARAADLAQRRGDPVDHRLREQLAGVRYLPLADTLTAADKDPKRWVADVADRFDVVIIDPLSAVAAALGLDFDKANSDYVGWYDRIIEPLRTAGPAVVALDNIGHDETARGRAKGVSAKGDKADLTFSVKVIEDGLLITARKVRSVRAAHRRDDTWTFDQIERRVTVRDHAMPGEPRKPFRPTVLMERISLAIELEPGLTYGNLVRRSDHVKGKSTHKATALATLIAEGYVQATQHGTGKGTEHTSLRPYREATDHPDSRPDSHDSHPTPTRLPESGTDTRLPDSLLRSRGVGSESGSDGAQNGRPDSRTSSSRDGEIWDFT